MAKKLLERLFVVLFDWFCFQFLFSTGGGTIENWWLRLGVKGDCNCLIEVTAC